MEPRDQVLHLAVGPLDELADVQNRSFLQRRARGDASASRFPFISFISIEPCDGASGRNDVDAHAPWSELIRSSHQVPAGGSGF